MITPKLPHTDSIQELARFWDAHDLTEFESELEEVSEAVFERETSLTIRLPPDDAQVVRSLANSRGMEDAELIREWVAEKVHSL